MSRSQTCKQIFTIGTCNIPHTCIGIRLTVVVKVFPQCHLNSCERQFTIVNDTVVVEVFPNLVSYTQWFVDTGINSQVVSPPNGIIV